MGFRALSVPRLRDAGCFATTRWSVVLRAAGHDSAETSEALAHLCRTYWYPLYSHARRCGQTPEDAADLTQEFFCRFLEKGYVSHANPARGRFRTFLLTSLNNFLNGEHVRATALKRGGGDAMLSLDDDLAERRYECEVTTQLTPDRAFDRNWALMTMRCAMEELEEECARAEKARLFRALQPFLARESSAGEYARLADELGMSTNGVAVAVRRLRERYGDLVRAQIAETVAGPAEVDEELGYLLQSLIDPA